jgi:hypothetical protein
MHSVPNAHPSWCSPSECRQDPDTGRLIHGSSPILWTVSGHTLTVSLDQAAGDREVYVMAVLSADGRQLGGLSVEAVKVWELTDQVTGMLESIR